MRRKIILIIGLVLAIVGIGAYASVSQGVTPPTVQMEIFYGTITMPDGGTYSFTGNMTITLVELIG